MVSKNEIIQIIYSAIDDINRDFPAQDRLEKSPTTVLFGSEGKLDSLSFINFVMATEKGFRERFGEVITLVTQEAMSSEESPFQTVEKLADYIILLRSGARRDV